jgi:hypothetical protein
MEHAAGRATHLLAALGRPMLSLALHSHADRTPLVVLRRWDERQAWRENRGAFFAAGSRSAPDRITAPNEWLRAMPRIAEGETTNRNTKRECDFKKGEFVFDAGRNKETISGVESKVTPPPPGTCAVAPPLGSSPGTFRIPG